MTLAGPFAGRFNACRILTDVMEVKNLGKADREPNPKPQTARDLSKTGLVFSPTAGRIGGWLADRGLDRVDVR